MLITSPAVLAIHLKDCRQNKKLTQSQVANSMGLRQATISEFERDPTRAQIDTLFKLAAALDLEIHLLPKSQVSQNEDLEW